MVSKMKTVKRYFLLGGVVSLLNTSALASDPETWGPVYADGPCKNLHQDECESLQNFRKKQADEKAAQELAWQKTLNEMAEEKRAKSEADERIKAQSAIKDAQRAAELKEYWAKEKAYKDAEAKAEAAAARRANEATAAQKASCGADYKQPRIGMSIDRVRACVTPVKVTAQLSRTDGVVTTYEGSGAYFHVMDGRVLSWGKY
jgi:hypothetical protein